MKKNIGQTKEQLIKLNKHIGGGLNMEIIATIGPSSSSFSQLKKMKLSGATIARLNTKYGSEKEWDSNILKLKKVGFKIMVDIMGLSVITWVNTKKVDYIAVSYTNSANQIKKIRTLLLDKNIKVISKIETKKGIKNVDEIIDESDGLMIARGDLSKNISFEKVPYFKRLILEKCKRKNKFVIVATEMLLSMVKSKKPTNAEVDDVFDSVLDGANAIMLSEETAIGKHPVLVVSTMKKIYKNAQKLMKKGIISSQNTC
jgi:pyruvate kinase